MKLRSHFMMNIPLAKPLLDNMEFTAVKTPLESGWLVQGPLVQQFETLVAQYCDVPYAVATSSCTTALHLSLLAAGIRPGDKVLVPSFTYVATANAVEHAGAEPVFIDIDAGTFNVSIAALEAYLKGCMNGGLPIPKALIPVHLFGLCADMAPIQRICEKYSMTIIEDAACAIGSFIDRKSAGSFGSTACFSFHPRKVITTGEGGMVVTGDKKTATQLKVLRDHGAEISDHARHTGSVGELPEFNKLGYNYRMTDIQGALGTAQMAKLPDILMMRKALARTYKQMLSDIPWLSPPTCPKGYTHTYQSYVCRIEIEDHSPQDLGKIRSTLMKHLDDKGVAARPGTHAVHFLGYYRGKYGLLPDHCPNALKAHHNAITLPLYPGMTEKEQTYVVRSISQFKP